MEHIGKKPHSHSRGSSTDVRHTHAHTQWPSNWSNTKSHDSTADRSSNCLQLSTLLLDRFGLCFWLVFGRAWTNSIPTQVLALSQLT